MQSSSHKLPIFDTGSTSNFGTIHGSYINKKPLLKPHPIACPNGSLMYATHEAELNLPSLPQAARHIYIVPDLASTPLISVGHLCDHGCSALFEQHQVTISHDGHPVLYGTRHGPNQLWQLDATSLATTPSTLVSAKAFAS